MKTFGHKLIHPLISTHRSQLILHWLVLPNWIWPVQLDIGILRHRPTMHLSLSNYKHPVDDRPAPNSVGSPVWPQRNLQIHKQHKLLFRYYSLNRKMQPKIDVLYSPNANPSFVHCTCPAKFVTSQLNNASDPSNTCKSCGVTRNFCCWAFAVCSNAVITEKEEENRKNTLKNCVLFWVVRYLINKTLKWNSFRCN